MATSGRDACPSSVASVSDASAAALALARAVSRTPALAAPFTSAVGKWRRSRLACPRPSHIPYGQPAPGAGASAVSTWPVRGPVSMFSGPFHSVAIVNSVLLSAPPSAGEAPAVKLDRLQHLSPLANAHATLVGDVSVPDGALGVEADAVGDAVSEVG